MNGNDAGKGLRRQTVVREENRGGFNVDDDVNLLYLLFYYLLAVLDLGLDNGARTRFLVEAESHRCCEVAADHAPEQEQNGKQQQSVLGGKLRQTQIPSHAHIWQSNDIKNRQTKAIYR